MDSNDNAIHFKNRKQTIEEIFEALITDGQRVPGDTGVIEDGRDIPWLDMDLAQAGQTFFAKNYTALAFAHGVYFGLGFGFKPITGMIVRTHGFHGPKKATRRLIATLWHVLRWYECDIIGCYAEGYKAIARVRKTHSLLRKKYHTQEVYLDEYEDAPADDILVALRKDLPNLDTKTFSRMGLVYNTSEPMSQCSLAITQLGFLLPVFAHPEAFGMKDLEGAEGFEHLWAIIGHLSGLEDRFNIPLHRPGRDVYVKILKEIFLPSFFVRDPNIILIQNSFYASTNTYAVMPSMGAAASLYYYLRQSDASKADFNGNELYKLIPWRERIGVLLMRLIMWGLTVSNIFRRCVNAFTRNMVQKVLDNYHLEQLKEGNELTILPKSTSWSDKYKKHNAEIVKKWKKTEAIIDMMSTKEMRWKRKKSHS